MLLAMLGLLRERNLARQVRTVMVCLGIAVVATGWWLEAAQALVLSRVMALGVGASMLLVCIRSARRGDRLVAISPPSSVTSPRARNLETTSIERL